MRIPAHLLAPPPVPRPPGAAAGDRALAGFIADYDEALGVCRAQLGAIDRLAAQQAGRDEP